MKTILPILAVLAFALKLCADETNSAAENFPGVKKISAIEATNFYDQTVVVTGKVAQVTVRPTVTFLNLDKKHPDSPFTVVIFHSHSSFYGDANALKGRSIEIKGKVKNYKDSPEMVLDSTNQLTVVGVTNLELFLKPKSAAVPTNSPAATSTNLPEIM